VGEIQADSSRASPVCTPRADQLLFIELSLADLLAVNGDIRWSFDADADLLLVGRDDGDDNSVADEDSFSLVACDYEHELLLELRVGW
jgi:hypothetical protein